MGRAHSFHHTTGIGLTAAYSGQLRRAKAERGQWTSVLNTGPGTLPLVYGHITLKTPVLVRSPKLSNVEPGQYLDG